MNNNLIAQEIPAEKESASSLLERTLSEKITDKFGLENRWTNRLNSLFSFLASSASRFFASGVKNDEITQIQSYTRHLFRKTDYVEKIRDNLHLQNVFLLGYCHAVDLMVSSFEEQISFRQNSSLKHLVSQYSHLEPILRILEQNFEMSHQDLANELAITPSALSNLMKKVEEHHLFNYTRVGKKKYYSLAHNGREALKIVKEDRRVSADEYTDFFVLLMDSLRKISVFDELKKDYVHKMCDPLLMKYTTQPSLCKKKLDDLALILKSERVCASSLLIFEKTVKKTVTVFTKDISSEKTFGGAILENLEKEIKYQWFFTETEQFRSPEEAQNYILGQLPKYNITNNSKSIAESIRCYILSQKVADSLLENTYDAVIYDEREGYSCEDVTISSDTLYNRMPQDRIDKLNQYVKEQSIA